jgi:hypothetical protein
MLTTKEQDKKLRKLGFFLDPASYPHQIPEEFVHHEPTEESKKWCHWCYTVICNQDEVIEFLIKNRISFHADVHYDHEAYFYDGKTDVLAIVQNFGKQYSSCNGITEEEELFKTKPIVKFKGKEYLKENKG